MKLKSMAITVAALTGLVVGASAQSVVSEIVGFQKTTVSNGLYIASVQFDCGTNDVSTVFGDSLPIGTTIYCYGDAGYQITSYDATFDWNTFLDVTNWTQNLSIDLGKGFWIELPTSAEVTTFGTITDSSFVGINLDSGLNLVSYPFPMNREVGELGLSPSIGDTVYYYAESGYMIASYEATFDWNMFVDVTNWTQNIEIPAGQGFWYETVSARQWDVEKPF